MDFQQKLSGLKTSIDRELEQYFDVSINEVSKSDNLLTEALKHTKKIALSGGKRIRGALLCQAYLGFGGKEKKKILKVAAAIELVHLFLLVHDDIIDRGDLRHGQSSLHQMFAKKYQKKYSADGAEHLGQSMAIIVGEMLFAIANKIIAEAGFSAKETLNALGQLQKIVSNTIVGQSQDIAIEHSKNVSQEEVLRMYENKTARYTFEGPLHLGAMLAGVSDRKTFEALSQYSLPLGIAFQIQDDILGVFGSEKKIGKSVASDIEEGKQSLLVVKAREIASASVKKQLAEVLGKKNITKKEIKIFQDILKTTGSLEYSKDLASEYIQKAKVELEKIIIKKEARSFLIGLNQYLNGREI